VTYIVLNVYILSVQAFPGNRNHDLGIAKTYFNSRLCSTN